MTQISFTFLPFYSFKVPQISQIHTDFYLFTLLPLKVPTDLTDSHRFLPFYFFTFKSHADCADDADFLPFYPFTLLPLKVPQAVPFRKIWRGL